MLVLTEIEKEAFKKFTGLGEYDNTNLIDPMISGYDMYTGGNNTQTFVNVQVAKNITKMHDVIKELSYYISESSTDVIMRHSYELLRYVKGILYFININDNTYNDKLIAGLQNLVCFCTKKGKYPLSRLKLNNIIIEEFDIIEAGLYKDIVTKLFGELFILFLRCDVTIDGK